MVSRNPTCDVDPASMVRAGLGGRLPSEQIPVFLAGLSRLADQEAALALRLGMVLACIKQFDLTELGYSGFLSFVAQRVDWRSSWARAIVRLVESPLDEVKAQAAAGRVPLRIAVTAPGRITAEDQSAWLRGLLVTRSPPAPPRRTFRGSDADAITRARELARACTGRASPPRALDAYILRHWRDRQPGKALEEGRTLPRAPDPRTLDFQWARACPGEALLGPWKTPTDLAEAIAQLDALQGTRRARMSLLARGFARVCADALWSGAGFASLWAFAETELGWSRRTAQRYRKLGEALERFPRLEAAVHAGFSPEAARQIGAVARDAAVCDRWLDLARHLVPHELKHALADGGKRLEEYERALHLARRHTAALLGPEGPTQRPSGTSAFVCVGHVAPYPPEAALGAQGRTSCSDGASAAGTPASPPRASAPGIPTPTEDFGDENRVAPPACLPGMEPLGERPASDDGIHRTDAARGPRTDGPATTHASTQIHNGTVEPDSAPPRSLRFATQRASETTGSRTDRRSAPEVGSGVAMRILAARTDDLPATRAGTQAPAAGSASIAGTTASGVRLRIALPRPEPARADRVRAHPDLAEAASGSSRATRPRDRRGSRRARSEHAIAARTPSAGA